MYVSIPASPVRVDGTSIDQNGPGGALEVAPSGVTPGTYQPSLAGSTLIAPEFTVGADGRITAAQLDNILLPSASPDNVTINAGGAGGTLQAVDLVASKKDPASNVAGLRTLGTGAAQAAAGSHASQHKNGGADEVATATPAANAIPKAGAGGTLAAGWIPSGVSGAAGAGGYVGGVVPVAGNTAFCPINKHQETGVPGLAENTSESIVPQAMTLSAIYVRNIGGANPAGNMPTFTVRKNGADTALAVTMTASEAQNTLHSLTGQSVSFAAGDRICMKVAMGTNVNAQVAHAWGVA